MPSEFGALQALPRGSFVFVRQSADLQCFVDGLLVLKEYHMPRKIDMELFPGRILL